MTTSLYRIYDQWDRLLYIGISHSTIGRLSQHRRDQPWADQIATIKVEYFDSRKEALEKEAEAIVNEAPRYNVVCNDSNRPDFAILIWNKKKPEKLLEAARASGFEPKSFEFLAMEPYVPDHVAWKLRSFATLIRLGAQPEVTFKEMFMRSPAEIDDSDHKRRIKQLQKESA